MAGAPMYVYRAIPGPTSLGPLIERFQRGGEGIVSSFDDALLPAIAELIDEDSDLELIQFGVLVRRALEAAGEDWLPLATRDQHAAAIGQAAEDLPEDSVLRRSCRFAGTRKALAKTLTELANWQVDVQDAAQIADGELGQKLKDLAVLQRSTLKLLSDIGRDLHSNQLANCCNAVWDPEGRPARLLIFAGADASPAKVEWLAWSAQQGCNVTVVVDRHATGARLFRSSELVVRALTEHCEVVEIGQGNRLLNNLFSSEPHGGPLLEAEVLAASDPMAECEWALRRCLELSSEHKTAIYVRDLESYGPLLKASGQRLGVSVKVPQRIGLCQNAFARLTLAVVSAFARDDVRRLRPAILSSYLAVVPAERRRMADSLDEAKKQQDDQWKSLREVYESSEEHKWLIEVLDWRERNISLRADLSEWSNHLRELVNDLPWQNALEAPLGYDARRDARAFHVMQSTLMIASQLDRASRAPGLSLVEFERRCRELWEEADVSVPASEGISVVTSAASIGNADTVLALGLLEGLFPRRRTEDPILTDSDRAAIAQLYPDRPSLPMSEEVAAEERDEFYRLCAAANERLVFSYPTTGEERDNIPAFYLELVRQALSNDPEGRTSEVRTIDRRLARITPERDECQADADIRIYEALNGPRETLSEPDLEIAKTREIIAPDPKQAYSPQELRDAIECAFKYQMRHRLDLKIPGRTSEWSRLRRLPEDASLPVVKDRREAEESLQDALNAELDKIVATTSEWEIQLLRAGGNRLVREWVEREFEARAIWPRDADSIQHRVSFGEKGLRDTMPGGIKLRGTASAVSSTEGGNKVVTLYQSRAPEKAKLTDSELLYYGLFFLAGYESDRQTAVEVDGFNGNRSLLVMGRDGFREFVSKQEQRLFVLDLGGSDDPAASREQFFKAVKALIKRATSPIEKAEIRPTEGDFCEWCAYGELCRRSRLFKDDDSPFGEDLPDEL